VADYEDPGWDQALRVASRTFIPLIGAFAFRRRSRSVDGLTQLRMVFLYLLPGPFLFLVALAFITPWDGADEGWVPVAVILLSAVALAGAGRVRRRAPHTGSPSTLAASYRVRFFICLGLAETPVFVGIAGTLIGGSLWICALALPFVLAGFALVAPTRRNIEWKQLGIRTRGSTLSLGQALIDHPTRRRN
jgi:hypothetical protein